MKANIAEGNKVVKLDNAKPTPELLPGEVLIKVAASPIQPSDFLNISGAFGYTRFPIIPGRDYAGTVTAPSTSSWYGKRVFGTSGSELSLTRDGAHAEYVALPENVLSEAPKNMDLVQASLIGTPWTTAYLTLHRSGAKPGETVLVIGASGSVGSAIGQLAKSTQFGCKVLKAGRGDKYDVDLTQYPDLSIAKDLCGGHGPDLVIDAAGQVSYIDAALKVLNKGGRVVVMTTGSSRGETSNSISVNLLDLYRTEHSIVGCNSLGHSMKEMKDFMDSLHGGFETGELEPPSSKGWTVIDLDGVVDAYKATSNGKRDKYLIVI